MSQSLSSRSRSWFVGRSRNTTAAGGSSQKILGSRFVGLAGHALEEMGSGVWGAAAAWVCVCGVVGGVYPVEVGV